jgi:hypothetical protein
MQNQAGGKQIAFIGEAFPVGQFGRGVTGRAEKAAGGGYGQLARQARQAEVGDFDATPFIHQQVLRLDVAVDEMRGMGLRQPGQDLPQDFRGQSVGERRVAFQKNAEIQPVDVFHGQKQAALGFADVENRNDVFMVQGGRGFGFGEESLPGFGLLPEMGVRNLKRHPAIQGRVPGQINRGHAAGSQLPLNGEAA